MQPILWTLTLASAMTPKQEQQLGLITFLAAGLIFIAISIPLIYEKIGPNQLYGFRTRKTLSNKEIWYKANKYMGKDLAILGGLIVVYNLVLFVIKPAILSTEPIGNLAE